MPQPLSNVKRDAKCVFNGYAAVERPFHAMRVGKAIAYAADIEAETITLFAEMLGGSSPGAAAIYMALRSASAQTAALDAVAEIALSPEDAERLSVIREVILSASKHRNRFAHWSWGTADDLPDFLLFLDPAYHRPHAINRARVLAKLAETGNADELGEALRYDPTRIFAYSLADLDEAAMSMFRASALLSLFITSIAKHDPLKQEAHDLLGAQREVAEGIRRRRRSPATPP